MRLYRRELKFEYFLIFFILLQPFIDLLTSFSIFILEVDLTFGIFIRFSVMFLVCIYILLSNYSHKKAVITYFVALAAVLLFGFVSNYFVKDTYSLFTEVKHYAKVVYFPILLFGYLIVFEKIRNNKNLQEKVYKYVFISMVVISIVMIISELTNTQIMSYNSEKIGHQGWFFAGNELGAILAINLGIVAYVTIKNTKSIKDIYRWIPLALIIYSMLQLGTKVGYGAVLIILLIALILSVYEFWKNRKSEIKKEYKISIGLNILFLILFLIYTPFAPVVSNMNIHFGWVGLDKIFENEESGKASQEDPIQDLDPEKKRKAIENVVFSGREKFLSLYKEAYREAPLVQKVFGMGYGGNNANNGNPIEMDFHDLFFSLGIAGFLVYLVPLLYFAFRILISLFKGFKQKFNLEFVLNGASILMGLGIAYTAGHTLIAPAVSIYLAVIIANLYRKYV